MPVKSAKQFRFMKSAAEGKTSMGPSKEVAKEFLGKTSHKQKSIFAKDKKK